eukprot:2437650-Pyramimonas_sp.AAC.1
MEPRVHSLERSHARAAVPFRPGLLEATRMALPIGARPRLCSGLKSFYPVKRISRRTFLVTAVLHSAKQ